MGRKRGKKGNEGSNPTPTSQIAITLRQEKSGKVKPRSFKPHLNLDHLRKLAVWASEQASMPSLAAFFGQRFAATAESMGITPDPSLFLCQRCETALLPGTNCTIQTENNKAKKRQKHKKSNNSTHDDVVYYCNYCSCRNVKRGTPKGHMKVVCPPESKASQNSLCVDSGTKAKIENMNENKKDCKATVATVQIVREIQTVDVPAILPATTQTINGLAFHLATIQPIVPAIHCATTHPNDVLATTEPIDVITATEPIDVITATEPIDVPTATEPIDVPTATEDFRTVDPPTSTLSTIGEALTINIPTTPPEIREVLAFDVPATPPSKNGETLTIYETPAKTGFTLLDLKKRKRKKSTTKKQTEPLNSCATTAEEKKTTGTSKRKRRKSWTSLKEMSQTNEQSGKIEVSLAIPFFLQGSS